MASSALEGRVAHAAQTLVVILLFHDARELFFDTRLDEVHYHVNADLLVHDGETALVLVARCDERWEQNLLEPLVMEVGNGQAAKLLNDRALTLAKECLVLFIVQAEVADQEHCLMK